MREANDWRLTNQLAYLRGASLEWKSYVQPSESWDHDHCAFCWVTFSADGADPKSQKEAFATPDESHWVCRTCFDDFVDLFEWKVSGQ